MCFSMESSFAAATVLTGIGVVSLRQVRKHQQYLMLASIPLLFAVQQAAEGIVWLTMNNQHYTWLNNMMGSVFLSFAMVVWPIWIPLSLFMPETYAWRKKMLLALTSIGTAIGCYSLYVMATTQLTIQIACNSISYELLNSPVVFENLGLCLYLIAAVAPFFVTRLKLGYLLGSGLIIALIVSKIFKDAAFGSVWCFCAAMLSLLVIVALKQEIVD